MGNRDLYKNLVSDKHFCNLSCMQAINDSGEFDMEQGFRNLFNSKQFVVANAPDENGDIAVTYEGTVYKCFISVENPMTGVVRGSHHPLSDREIKSAKGAKNGVILEIYFSEESQKSYHLQLKLLKCLVPDLKAVIDINIGIVLSGRWVSLVAASEVLPNPEYLYMIEAIEDKDSVWMHTHGLDRVGSVDFEILGIPKSEDQLYPERNVIDTVAKEIINNGFHIKPNEPLSIGDNLDVVWNEWEKRVSKEERAMKEEIDHTDPCGVLELVQEDENDSSKLNYFHVSEAREYLQDNPLFYFTSKETERMAALAIERIDFLINAVTKLGAEAIVKYGIIVDDQYQNEEKDAREFCWFKLESIEGDQIKGVLLNEPYYLDKVSEGDLISFPIKDVTDWQLYSEEYQIILPDTVYLLTSTDNEGRVGYGEL